MMSPGETVMQSSKNEDGALGSRRLLCPIHGCKRVYKEQSALESHIMDHKIPAQSLPGKKLLCSSSGCSASFPSMQKLMEHTRRHYKPNIYFQCESCRTKLRSYRGLLAHLHTCSKVPRAKPKAAEPATPLLAAVAASNPAPRTSELAPPQLESVSPQQAPIQTTSVPSAATVPDSADPPVLGPPMLTLQEATPPQHVEGPPQSPLRDAATKLATSFRPIAPKAAADLAAPGSTTHPASAAVWRKNQAMSSHRRVLWEHTRGRYTCVQCGHTVTNRKEMTQHINSQHHGNKSGEEAGSSVPKS
ncbi:zinc finger protein 414 isoform X1 [Gambusia affinis]|uniref:zinc finger protein 414 isoform X1 n=2 Tax=Gambusia affinis TaxID=33528 RepID=UPI000F381B7E|nr:zinc finger protein 414 isoform X1 [Gambusia affinis]